MFGLILSCSDDNTDINKSNLESSQKENYYKIYNSEAKNHIILENLGGIYDKNKITNITSFSLDSTPKDITINGEKLLGKFISQNKGGTWSSQSDISSLFGKKVSIKKSGNNYIISNNVSNKGGDEISWYIPEIISATVTGLVDGKVVPGTTVTWNKDQNNLNGISMMVEYSPYEQSKSDISKTLTENETKVKSIEDNGYYVVTEEDLKQYPKGTNLNFYFGRTAYYIDVTGDITEDTSLGAVSAVRADFEISY